MTEFLERHYTRDISLDEACILAAQSIYLVSEDKEGTKHIKISVIDGKEKRMRKLEDDEIVKYANKAREIKS